MSERTELTTSLRVIQVTALVSVLAGAAMTAMALAPEALGLAEIAASQGSGINEAGRFLFGLIGATWAAMAIMSWGLGKLAVDLRAPTATHPALIGLGVWFVIDCVLSVALGATLNIVGNALYLAAFAVPLWQIRTRCGERSASGPRVASSPVRA